MTGTRWNKSTRILLAMIGVVLLVALTVTGVVFHALSISRAERREHDSDTRAALRMADNAAELSRASREMLEELLTSGGPPADPVPRTQLLQRLMESSRQTGVERLNELLPEVERSAQRIWSAIEHAAELQRRRQDNRDQLALQHERAESVLERLCQLADRTEGELKLAAAGALLAMSERRNPEPGGMRAVPLLGGLRRDADELSRIVGQLKEPLKQDDIEDLRENRLPQLIDRMVQNVRSTDPLLPGTATRNEGLVATISELLVGGPLVRDEAQQVVPMSRGSLLYARSEAIRIDDEVGSFIIEARRAMDQHSTLSNRLRTIATEAAQYSMLAVQEAEMEALVLVDVFGAEAERDVARYRKIDHRLDVCRRIVPVPHSSPALEPVEAGARGNDVDGAGSRVATIERALRSAQGLDPLKIEEVGVEQSERGKIDLINVDTGCGIVGRAEIVETDAADRDDRQDARAVLLHVHIRELADEVRYLLDAALLDRLGSQRIHGRTDIDDVLRPLLRRDDDHV